MLGKLGKLAAHVRNGTLGQRIWLSIRLNRERLSKALATRRREARHRAWMSQVASGKSVDFPVRPGVNLRLYPDSLVAKSIFVDNYELAERTFLWRYLAPGDAFVDVGANIGLFTVLAAARVGPAGRVVSFEPSSVSRRRLIENIALNCLTNVHVDSRGLSDRTESLTIHVPLDGHDAWGSFAAPIAGNDVAEESASTVPWDTLSDDFATPTMMKIDVEGWELCVLEGAAARLSAPDAPLLQVEFTDAAAESAGHSCRDVYRRLVEFGYTICNYDAQLNVLVPEGVRDAYPYVNLYATKRLRQDNERLRAR